MTPPPLPNTHRRHLFFLLTAITGTEPQIQAVINRDRSEGAKSLHRVFHRSGRFSPAGAITAGPRREEEEYTC